LNFIALSGLPRTGSTLLSAILSQNPNIHAEGNSAVCQLMWVMHKSCEVSEQLKASQRYQDQDVLVSAIPKLYYRNTKAEYIVDKCRSWTLYLNTEMIKRYITKNPKIIVMTRPVDEILDSVLRLYKDNNVVVDKDFIAKKLFEPGSEPLMRSLDGVKYAQKNNNGEFLFIEYSDLIADPKETIESIYKFCDIESFKHNFQKIINKHPEDDDLYGLKNIHKVYSSIRQKVQPDIHPH